MRINFKRIEIKNFLSYQEETFDFDEHKGINLIYGKNLDVPESKNGCGKCLDPSTRITVEMDDETYNKLLALRKSTAVV